MLGPSREFLSMIDASVQRLPCLRQTCVGNATLIFLREDNIFPLQTCLQMNSKDVQSDWAMISNVVGDQSTSDSVITNKSLVVANCLSYCFRDSSESITHMLTKDIPILTWCYNSRTTSSRSVSDIVCCVSEYPTRWSLRTLQLNICATYSG